MACWANIFFACGALKGGFAYGTMPDSPGSGTLVRTLIPVGSEGWCPPKDEPQNAYFYAL